jgi:hypothetical protein
VVGLLALLALLASGAAFWIAREAQQQATDRTEVEQLRQEVDSLRARLNQIEEPFGPTAPAPGSPNPAQPTGAATAPR